ncbi:hypothetical protein DL95DRAFT_397445, partial [Leptodontidium sp. 2 PMI_412]
MPLIPRVPPRLRHGRTAKDTAPRSARVLGRKYIRGVREQETVRELAQWRILNNREGIGEPRDQERA